MLFLPEKPKYCRPGHKKYNRIIVKDFTSNFPRKGQRIYARMKKVHPVAMIGIGNKMMLQIPDDDRRDYNQTDEHGNV